MADFKTHIGTSTVVGIGYGAIGLTVGELPLATCMLSAGLCSISGMLPDLDSDSGIPLRETIAFIAAGIPMLLLPRFHALNMSNEQIVLAGGLIYIFMRFGMVEIFKRYTVHRGMWHSIPAAISVGLIAFLLCSGPDLGVRFYKTGAVVLGFMVHLVLDEIWSIEMKKGRMRIKKSFGTAMKFWSTRSMWANVSTYGKLIVFALLAMGDPMLSERLDQPRAESAGKSAREIIKTAVQPDQNRTR